jgi:23S rRNA G2069 N7-methylase RlmK/C1962 C5-methylase RlmI
MKVVRASAKMCSIIRNHQPTGLSPLWVESFNPVLSTPGFYSIMDQGNKQISTLFYDGDMFPCINILPPISSTTTIPGLIHENLSDSLSKRFPLPDSEAASRVVNGRYDKLPGITVDLYAMHAIVCIFSPFWLPNISHLVSFLTANFPLLKSVRVVERVKGKKLFKCRQIWGEVTDNRCEVIEHGCKFRINLENGQSTGLFLDQAENRKLLPTLAPHGSSFLNLFAYVFSE